MELTFNDMTIYSDMCFELLFEDSRGDQHVAYIDVYDFDYDGLEATVTDIRITSEKHGEELYELQEEIIEMINGNFTEELTQTVEQDARDHEDYVRYI